MMPLEKDQMPSDRRTLLTRMDDAFSIYCREAEKLSELLAAHRDPFSWTSYHDLLRRRTAEVACYEKYRNIRDELFKLINPPAAPDRPKSSVS
ncbi:MAG TPA: hypothetical protein VNK23_11090 [Candidatus Dormibacteraeota bacterium]|nr:hypothetical protein [Candidatus Dormibacteraeota bacterium]